MACTRASSISTPPREPPSLLRPLPSWMQRRFFCVVLVFFYPQLLVRRCRYVAATSLMEGARFLATPTTARDVLSRTPRCADTPSPPVQAEVERRLVVAIELSDKDISQYFCNRMWGRMDVCAFSKTRKQKEKGFGDRAPRHTTAAPRDGCIAHSPQPSPPSGLLIVAPSGPNIPPPPPRTAASSQPQPAASLHVVSSPAAVPSLQPRLPSPRRLTR